MSAIIDALMSMDLVAIIVLVVIIIILNVRIASLPKLNLVESVEGEISQYQKTYFINQLFAILFLGLIVGVGLMAHAKTHYDVNKQITNL